MDEDIRQHLTNRRYEEAFGMLVERYQRKVFSLALSMLRNPAQAEDTAQDIFLKLWHALPGYSGAASLSTWLFVIARNTCLTQIRSNSYRAALSLEEPAVRTVADKRQSDPAANMDVKRLVARLPEKSRQVLSLFYFQDKSYEDVAAIMEIPVGTVKSHLHRARKALSEMLGVKAI